MRFGRVFWGFLVGLNTVLLFQSVLMGMYPSALFNFCIALLCWVGYFNSMPSDDEIGDNDDR